MFVVGGKISIAGSQRWFIPLMGGGEYRHCLLDAPGNEQKMHHILN